MCKEISYFDSCFYDEKGTQNGWKREHHKCTDNLQSAKSREVPAHLQMPVYLSKEVLLTIRNLCLEPFATIPTLTCGHKKGLSCEHIPF